MIENRQLSQSIKARGDLYFQRKDLDEALTQYQLSLAIDPSNEYATANIGLIHFKNKSYEECEEFTKKALKIIMMFHEDTKEFASDTKLHVKLLQRLSKCYEVRADESKSAYRIPILNDWIEN